VGLARGWLPRFRNGEKLRWLVSTFSLRRKVHHGGHGGFSLFSLCTEDSWRFRRARRILGDREFSPVSPCTEDSRRILNVFVIGRARGHGGLRPRRQVHHTPNPHDMGKHISQVHALSVGLGGGGVGLCRFADFHGTRAWCFLHFCFPKNYKVRHLGNLCFRNQMLLSTFSVSYSRLIEFRTLGKCCLPDFGKTCSFSKKEPKSYKKLLLLEEEPHCPSLDQ
jgi:hypothetical protein